MYVNEEFRLWRADGLATGDIRGLPSYLECKEDICVLFSGEDFADQTDIDAFSLRGHEFDPDEASYLVRLYEGMGCGLLEELNGWFGSVLLDLRGRTSFGLTTGGVNRLHYHEDAHAFCLSSEANAVLKVLPVSRQLLCSLGGIVFCEAVLQMGAFSLESVCSRLMLRGIETMPLR